MSARAPYILFDDQTEFAQRYYTAPKTIITARKADEISPALKAIEAAYKAGNYLAGYFTYEMGAIFEPKLRPLLQTHNGPLLQFGVFETVSDQAPTELLYNAETPQIALKAAWTLAAYSRKFSRLMDYIKAGDAYQVNLTFPLNGNYEGNAAELYAALRHRQKGRYGGVISLGGGPDIISLSPELFFRKSSQDMVMRPMKGTRSRINDRAADQKARENMRADLKSRAENLMIVDLLRNDLSRISETGSVEVPELFALETYPTLHQMTSRVTSQLRNGVNFEDIFSALYPCGSVTGAPKIRAMEIINELEDGPRGTYCGSMGYIDPDGQSCFNVAIRTLCLENKRLIYGVGSGVVLDSDSADEYEECLLKADVLSAPPAQLIETLKWDPDKGFVRLAAHRHRLETSAKDLKYPFSAAKFDAIIASLKLSQTAQRVRLSLSPSGIFNLTQSPLAPIGALKIAISRHHHSKKVQHSKHKISQRDFYDGERERLQNLHGADEVLFLTQSGELSEGSFTSLFIERDGVLLTPPLSSRALPGILRAELIAQNSAVATKLTVKDLQEAKKILMGNSLRGLMEGTLISDQLL